jgi:hypothetical protein
LTYLLLLGQMSLTFKQTKKKRQVKLFFISKQKHLKCINTFTFEREWESDNVRVTCYLPSEGRISGFLFGDQCTEDDIWFGIYWSKLQSLRERVKKMATWINKRASACEIFYFNNIFSDHFLFIYTVNTHPKYNVTTITNNLAKGER